MINKLETSVFQLILHIHNEVIDRSDSSYVLSNNLFIYYIYDSSIKIKSSSTGYSITFNEENKTFAKCSLLKKYVPNTELLNIVGRIIKGQRFPFRIKELKTEPIIDYAIFDSKKSVNFFDQFSSDITEIKDNSEKKLFDSKLDTADIANFKINQWIKDEVNLFDVIVSNVRTEYLGLNTGVKEIDYLLSSVLKDNVITEVEEKFLIQKLNENNLDEEILEKAKEFLDKSNPYLDGIIHIIFDDLKITKEELIFLNEKCKENNISIEIAIRRFWQIGFIYYPEALMPIPNFQFWLKLIYIISTIEGLEFRFIYLNVFSLYSIQKVIDKAFVEELNYFKELTGVNDVIEIDHILSLLKFDLLPKNAFDSIDSIQMKNLIRIIDEEINRIGSNDAFLIGENIKCRIGWKNQLGNHKENDLPSNLLINESIVSNKDNGHETNNGLNKIKFNNTYFNIERIRTEFKPLFVYEFNRQNGSYVIKINTGHKAYKKESESTLIKLSAAMYYSKLTMSDPNISKYIQRVTNNLELAEDE